jgi:hypothetical protein
MKNLFKQKYPQTLLLVLSIAIVGGWQLYNRMKHVQEEAEKTVSFVPVETTIESVFPSGKGFRRTTIITVSYLYESKKYSKTIRMGGYVEGRFQKGNKLTLYLNPSNPEEITVKKQE